MNAALVCQHLVKRYGRFTALAGLDLEVPRGTVYGLLGPNGAGKTTTLRLLAGLARPTAGRIAIAGGESPGQRVGYLGQQPQFYPWLSGRELLRFLGTLEDCGGTTLEARINDILEQTGLSEAADRRVGGYSGGMKQRLGLAAALLHKPAVLLLDEPVSALDPEGRRAVFDLIARLREDTTILVSTHLLADVERVCERVAILHQGRLVTDAAMADLHHRFAQASYTIELEPEHRCATTAFAAELKEQPWVSAVTTTQEGLDVAVPNPADGGPRLLALLGQRGLPIVGVARRSLTLEEIYLRLIADERTTEPQGGA